MHLGVVGEVGARTMGWEVSGVVAGGGMGGRDDTITTAQAFLKGKTFVGKDIVILERWRDGVGCTGIL